MRKQNFKMRVTSSGSAGVALYIPAHIVKLTGLKDKVNQKLICLMDEDGDIFVNTNLIDDGKE